MMIDGAGLVDVMPAESVSVEDEEDLSPPAEQSRRVVPHHS